MHSEKKPEYFSLIKQKGQCCPTLDEFFQIWMNNRRGTVRGSTERVIRERYKSISSFIPNESSQNIGNIPLQMISRQHVKDLRYFILKDHATSTTNSTIALLKSIMDEALNEQLIDRNPCNGIRAVKRVEAPARDTIHRALSIGETQKFLKYAENSWYYGLYRFLLYSGMRCGEACALKRPDIRDDFIRIRKTVIRTDSGFGIGELTKTDAGNRDIPLTEELQEIIEFQNKVNMDNFCGNKDAGDWILTDRIFNSYYGGIISTEYPDSDIKKICSESGIEPFTVHAFRDTFATRAIESGMNPKTLQELLGHSSYEITMTLYAHVMPSTKIKEMNMIKIE